LFSNNNIPIIVGSPKLFSLLKEVHCDIENREFEGKKIKIKRIQFNNKSLELARFGDVAEVKQGLATGDNKYYLYQKSEARGSYRDISNNNQFLLSEEDLAKLGQNEKVRLKVIENGIHKNKDEKAF